MRINLRPFKNWFGFTRRERRASSILLLIILMVIALRYIVPGKDIELQEIDIIMAAVEEDETSGRESGSGAEIIPGNVQYIYFDPNTVSYDTLMLLGLTSKSANTLIRYRERGGVFRQPEDIKRIYGIDQERADTLIYYIRIVSRTGEREVKNITTEAFPLIDINRCDTAVLLSLPGIGPVLSSRIIKYRSLLGGFISTGQLKEVYGLHDEVYTRIKERFLIDTSVIVKIDINRANFRRLQLFPYLEDYEVSAILKYRELMGEINNMTDLTENLIIEKEKAERLRPYIDFR